MKVRICFVCLGNICRSPTAEGVMLNLVAQAGLAESFVIDSAGTGGHHVGERPDPRTLAAANARGLQLKSRARRFEQADFARFDHVIAMDQQNATDLRRLARDDAERDKVRLLLSFSGDPASPRDVPDPYCGGSDGFEHVLSLCEEACGGLLSHIRQSVGW